MSTATRIVVIGNGSFGANCLKVISSHTAAVVPLVIADPNAHAMRGLLPDVCRRMQLPIVETGDVNAPEMVRAIADVAPDYIVSAYNMRILKRALLELPRLGTINFHNGPLPRYRGVNVYSWAILNGESEYGVTWHLVDGGIDTGDILGQKMFALDSTETPRTLIGKGFKAGVELLGTILPGLLGGTLTPIKQDEAHATYYSKRDIPNGGRIDYRWSASRLERFVRSLDFRPLENTFVHPTSSFRGVRFHPQTSELVERTTRDAAGRIVELDDRALHVQVADAVVGLSDVLDTDGRPVTAGTLAARLNMRSGDVLDCADGVAGDSATV
jgi:methionyl-tRNA formyltransferase